ncbi:hypothetical protein CIHG_00893 [Coccidioides immitis H538.4]|uniref:Protein kinase domain-containing protein n=1 Tax=Coccidioides immitis H538.4 TaxID=396776 RepID=A0A0J8REV6_COCIT|nr:hypothetical protein CIHG_00893 [Coccidioides immitis H538.4]
MDSFQSVVAAVEIVQVTIKVLRVGYDTVSDVKQYGTDAAKLGLKFQQLSHRYDALQKVLFEGEKFPFLHAESFSKCFLIKARTSLFSFSGSFCNYYWLKRTKAILEDAWWPLPAFNVLSNLNTLQSDTDARTAGFAASTAIRKLLIDQTKLPQALSAPWTSVNNSKTISSDKIVGVFEGSAVLVETLTFPVDDDGELSDILEERFSKIVRLLSSQSDPDFRVLRCLRYCKQISANSGQLRLISCLSGSNATPTTRTLVGLYHGIKPDQRPSLGLRFNMCHQLAESLFLLHSVDWVHRALRSENVLFLFPDESLNRAALQRAEIRICGFEASRPSVDSSLGGERNQLAGEGSASRERGNQGEVERKA